MKDTAPSVDETVKVLATTRWEVHWGGLNNARNGGLEGRLTKLLIKGVVCYVRENVALAGGGFHVSASERMGMKLGRLSRRHEQVLELCCPEGFWEELADEIQRADALGRRVRRNRNFTAAWAERQFAEKKGT